MLEGLQQSLFRFLDPLSLPEFFYVRSVSDPPAGPCVRGLLHGNFGSQYTLPSVQGPGRFTIKLNLLWTRLVSAVPANGCLATLHLRCLARIEDSSQR